MSATKDQLNKSVSEPATGVPVKKSSAVVPDLIVTPAPAPNLKKTSTRRQREEWNIGISSFAQLTINPIRCIVEGLKLDPNPDKSFIPLSLGESQSDQYYYLGYHLFKG